MGTMGRGHIPLGVDSSLDMSARLEKELRALRSAMSGNAGPPGPERASRPTAPAWRKGVGRATGSRSFASSGPAAAAVSRASTRLGGLLKVRGRARM